MAVIVAEIRYGLEWLPDGRRKQRLLAAATEVFAAFSDYIQPESRRAGAVMSPPSAGLLPAQRASLTVTQAIRS